MLLTEELTKIALVFNSKGFLRLRHCDKNSENFFRYHYYYNCYLIISIIAIRTVKISLVVIIIII